MKLTKDQIQKIMLGAMMLIAVIYGFIEFLISPAQLEGTNAVTNAELLEPKILAAKKQIAKTQQLSVKVPDANKLSEQVASMIPEGSPVAWFPPKVSEYFKRHGIDKVTSRQNTEVVDKELTGFRKLAWGVELPKVEFIPFGAALAELENEEPLMEIQAIDIEASRDDVQFQRATITISNLVRQQ